MCARAAVVLALHENVPEKLKPLLSSGTALVRAEALSALAGGGDVAPAVAALVDRSPVVRRTAQVAVRQVGISPAEHYRERVLNQPPPPAVLAGLVLAAWLDDDEPSRFGSAHC